MNWISSGAVVAAVVFRAEAEFGGREKVVFTGDGEEKRR